MSKIKLEFEYDDLSDAQYMIIIHRILNLSDGPALGDSYFDGYIPEVIGYLFDILIDYPTENNLKSWFYSLDEHHQKWVLYHLHDLDKIVPEPTYYDGQ